MSLNTIRNWEESLGCKLIMFSERLLPKIFKNIKRERSLCAGNELEEPQEGGWSCLPTTLSLTPGTAQGKCFCAKHQENP